MNHKKRFVQMGIVLYVLVFFNYAYVDVNAGAQLSPEINANGISEDVTIGKSDTLTIGCGLNASEDAGKPADWWLVVDTTSGWFSYNIVEGWQSNIDVTYQGALFDFPPTSILEMRELPSAIYAFYFGIDLTIDGNLNLPLYYDQVVVNILDELYVYKDYLPEENNFIPCGWMGDIEAISFDDKWNLGCYSGSSCIKQSFTARSDNWAGIYWLDCPEPAKCNWGTFSNGGHDLGGCSKITFKAKGENGGEQIEFFAGGIDGLYGDSFKKVTTGYIPLTRNWHEYSINFDKSDLSRVVGGFGWVTNNSYNPNGATFYLDEIKYLCTPKNN
ncbi:MAG: hypothetical protein U9Q67_02550 [Patescibacteria group bacterium]|nr:hypothetical protein [Patescibacteria group bacterium]